MLLSCERATELVEKSQVEGFSLLEKTRLSLHLKLCKLCKDYALQSEKLNAYIERFLSDEGIPDIEELQDEQALEALVQRIQKALEEEN